ncbi:cytochrome c oxidase assembly protein COX11, mitochondrial [Colletes gigas]|uniref:cytochrome c oxidase assembly protein COX11, mitochondrial n=1 Tax=Colletes gigas TaxID=935657 RepID=UPI001C9A701D|nr:cytochrome c oxidase assembly protein COX11, mitochondrial [Colletes gigas]
MYFKAYQKLFSSHARQIHTNVSRILYNRHYGVNHNKNIRSSRLYWSGFGVLVVGLSYAAVPLYRIFCQAYSYGGTVSTGHEVDKVSTMKPIKDKVLKISFNADTAATMLWNFKPQQNYVKVVPGETALAFYTAKNPLNETITGISTYNVVPFEAGQYFNKIQCFCFEEQQLNPHEEVDMPVFFYIDPQFSEDPRMEHIDEIILSYTFFEAKPGVKIPLPKYLTERT